MMTPEEIHAELERCKDPEYFMRNYCRVEGTTLHWNLPDELKQPLYEAPPSDPMIDQQRLFNRMLSQLPPWMNTPNGTYLPVPISHYRP